MNRRYSKKGLRLIALEAQNSTEEAIASVVKKQKMKFTVARRGSIPGRTGNTIPHMLIYGADGALLWQGNPSDSEAEKTIRRAVKEVVVAGTTKSDGGNDIFAKKANLVEERDWTNTDGKTLKAALVSVTSGKGFFKRSNGRTFTYEIAKLSEADQKLIEERSAPAEAE
jgi:hypothetical protein